MKSNILILIQSYFHNYFRMIYSLYKRIEICSKRYQQLPNKRFLRNHFDHQMVLLLKILNLLYHRMYQDYSYSQLLQCIHHLFNITFILPFIPSFNLPHNLLNSGRPAVLIHTIKCSFSTSIHYKDESPVLNLLPASFGHVIPVSLIFTLADSIYPNPEYIL